MHEPTPGANDGDLIDNTPWGTAPVDRSPARIAELRALVGEMHGDLARNFYPFCG